MFKNYFTIALRTILKNKLFAGINILGLAIGISASIVIYLLVDYHFNFDKFEKDNDRIYRVVTNFKFSGVDFKNSGVTDPLADAVQKEITGLDAVIPFRRWTAKVSVPQSSQKDLKVFKNQSDLVFADENFFNMVGYEWIAGSPKGALKKSYQTVLTQSIAQTYFPKLSPAEIIGRTVFMNDTVRLTVTGIVKDLSQNSDFTFKTFISYNTLTQTSLKPSDWDSWSSTNGDQQLYIKLSNGTGTTHIEKLITQVQKNHEKKDPDDHGQQWYKLQPLSDVRFNADYGAYKYATASKPMLYSLLAIAVFLLLLGCINFINLTTAQSVQRSKEIGIRKTMGSTKKQLIFQFLSETLLLTSTAAIVSFALTPIILKEFSGFIPEDLHFTVSVKLFMFLLAIIVVVTLLSGFYPAIVLSAYKPVLVLKNQAFANTATSRKALLRKSLTVSQFVIAQVFIMATLLVSKQIHFSLNKDMGFKKDAILYFTTNFYDTVASHKPLLMDKLKAIPEIAMISLCTNPPSSNSTWSSGIKYKDGKKEVETEVHQKFADSNYIKVYNIRLLAGRNIATTDTVTSILINETYAHILGFQNPADAVGIILQWNRPTTVCGVVADFNQASLHAPIQPMVIASNTSNERTFSIALQPQNESGTTWKNTISKIEKAWKEVYPDDDFEYHFFDEEIAKYYESEKNISSLLSWATGLAVLISCLGLLGLVIYTTTQRTKEIGVRKVLGATVAQIVSLISKDFIILVLIAFVIAVPLAWLGMNKWLENFAYRTTISWWIFVASGITMIVIALITLGFQTVKAAVVNPVKSLRTE